MRLVSSPNVESAYHYYTLTLAVIQFGDRLWAVSVTVGISPRIVSWPSGHAAVLYG